MLEAKIRETPFFWKIKRARIDHAKQKGYVYYNSKDVIIYVNYILFTDVGNELALPGFQITSNILDNGSEVDSPDDCQEKCIR